MKDSFFVGVYPGLSNLDMLYIAKKIKNFIGEKIN